MPTCVVSSALCPGLSPALPILDVAAFSRSSMSEICCSLSLPRNLKMPASVHEQDKAK